MKYVRRYKHKHKLKRWNPKIRRQSKSWNYRLIFCPYIPIYMTSSIWDEKGRRDLIISEVS